MTTDNDLTQTGKTYTSDDVDVRFDLKRCIHARECVRGLGQVFDVDKRPWIQPANAGAGEIAEVIHRCPSGALHYTRKDGGTAETPDAVNTVRVVANGPLHVRGTVRIVNDDDSVFGTDMRASLCRCGASGNKPFCDNSHEDAGFAATDALADNLARSGTAAPAENTPLTVKRTANGPLLLQGDFEIISSDGQTVFRGNQTALCRCGGSSNKPFCDGTHHAVGFAAE